MNFVTYDFLYLVSSSIIKDGGMYIFLRFPRNKSLNSIESHNLYSSNCDSPPSA